MSEFTVLLVDDDDVFRQQLGRAFTRRGATVLLAGTHAEAKRLVREHHPERAVLDLKMPDGDGLSLLRELLAESPELKVIMLTGYGSIAAAIEATRLGALNFVQKPADADDVLAAFERGEGPPLEESTDYQAPSLARAEWEHINRVLHDCGGNISETARRLGIHRRTLQRKLEKYPPNT